VSDPLQHGRFARPRRHGDTIERAIGPAAGNARRRALAFAEAGEGPLAEDWTSWRVPAEWPLPTLPDGVLITHW
jgi:hypothetical protein